VVSEGAPAAVRASGTIPLRRAPEAVAWAGVFTTAGTPAEIIGRLNAEVNRIIRLPAIAMKFDEQGLTPVGGSPTEFGVFISRELRRWKDTARAANVSAE